MDDIDTKQHVEDVDKTLLKLQIEREKKEAEERLKDRSKPCFFDIFSQCTNPMKLDKSGKKISDKIKCTERETCEDYLRPPEADRV